jgi:hypothetical protein
MKTMVKPDFQNHLSQQVLLNSAKSLLTFKQKFNPDFMKNGILIQSELNNLVKDVCHKKVSGKGTISEIDLCTKMDPKFKIQLAKELINHSKNSINEKLTPIKAMASLNEAINRLNSSLSKISISKDIGYIYDSADMTNEQTKLDFDKYVNQYMSEVSKDAGSLLLTKKMKDESGSIKSFNKDDTEKNNKLSRFQFTKHKNIKLSDVTDSINEVEEKILRQVKDTLSMVDKAHTRNGTITASDGDINTLVKINSFAAGQMLLKKPEYAGMVCDSINQINSNDDFDDDLDKYFTVGAAVLGGALLLTGVGTLAGAYLITGSLTAGVAAGTVGGSILGYTALAGTAVELSSLSYYGKKSYDNYIEMNQLESAFLNQNTDTTAILEAKTALIEFKDARISAGLSLAGAGLSLLSAGSLFQILKTTEAKVSPDQIKAASKIMRYISQTATARKLKDIALILGDKGIDKIDAFLLQLAKVSETGRVKFLELLNNSKMTPEKIKEVIESALDAAKNCKKI